MLRTDLPDHRRASEADLVAALRARDPLALAEAYHRTIPAAHACARRLLSASSDVEALLRTVYDDMWRNPPEGVGLEGWVRTRTFDLGVAHLRETGTAPASPSLASLLDDLPNPEVRYLDAAERALSELDERQRRALLLAHDRGTPTERQDDPGAAAALVSALFALAGPEPGGQEADGDCNVTGLGDWVLGLLPTERAEQVAAAVAGSPGCEAAVKGLRRGRRRLEGLPPTPDMGQRVLVVVLAGAPAAVTPTPPPVTGLKSALDTPDEDTPPARAVEDEDTGDLGDAFRPPMPPAADAGGPVAEGDATAAYAELAALDTAEAAPAADSDEELPPLDEDYERPRRSLGRRVVGWLLGILFLAAGVALGLYIGITFLGRL